MDNPATQYIVFRACENALDQWLAGLNAINEVDR